MDGLDSRRRYRYWPTRVLVFSESVRARDPVVTLFVPAAL